MSRAHAERGITVVELLAATGLLGIVVVGIILVTKPGFAQGDSGSERNLAPLTAALSDWRASHAGECPTLGQLELQGYLMPQTSREDAWGGTYRVACDQGNLALLSAGPDGALGTKDDLRIPAN